MGSHPGILHLMAHPGLKVLPTCGVLPPGWRHAVGLYFYHRNTDPPALDCVLSVNRSAAERDFADAEMARLGALHGEIDVAREHW